MESEAQALRVGTFQIGEIGLSDKPNPYGGTLAFTHSGPYAMQGSWESVARSAIAERDELRSRVKELSDSLEMLAHAMETIAKAAPELVMVMEGLEWMPKEARSILAKRG
jgi:hypothetical protein